MLSGVGVSVVIATRNKRGRLALVLAGLEAQHEPPPFEVIVVDDGTSDGSSEMLRSYAGPLRLEVVRIDRTSAQGMNAKPRNRGASCARGSILIFLDDDAVPGRDLVAAHAHALSDESKVSRGAFRCIPAAEWLSDPATGALFEEVDGERVPWEVPPPSKPLLTRDQVLYHPERMREISQPGLYPSSAATERALRSIIESDHPCSFLAPVPHNLALTAKLFWSLGGWDVPELQPWLDLGVKLQRAGARFVYSEAATSHHLYHHRLRFEYEKAESTGAAFRILETRYPEIHWRYVMLWLNTFGESPYEPLHLRFSSLERLARLALGGATKQEALVVEALLKRHPMGYTA